MKIRLLSAIAATVMALNLTSCQGVGNPFADTAEQKKQVLTVECELGNEPVQYKEYRYFFMNNKNSLYGADAVMDADMTAKVKQLTEDNIRKFHVVSLAAEKHGAEFTSKEKKDIKNYTKDYREGAGLDDDSYKLLLEQNYTTDSFFTSLYENTLLSDKLFEKLLEDGTVPAADKIVSEVFPSDEIICIKEIFINHNGGETVEIARKMAEDIFTELQEGAEFETLMREKSSYNESEVSPEHGYYTSEYVALEPIWEAANDLVEGEYSTVVESVYGFHIIMRCEKDSEYMEKHNNEIAKTYQESVYNEYLEGLMNTMTLTYSEYGASLDLASMS